MADETEELQQIDAFTPFLNETLNDQNEENSEEENSILNSFRRNPENTIGPTHSIDEFKTEMLSVFTEPTFSDLPGKDKLKKVAEVYNSKPWVNEVEPLLKDTTTEIWRGVPPEEQPDFEGLIGVPPLVPKEMDVEKATQEWKNSSLQKTIQSGVNPNFFGKQFDDYLEGASQIEKDAYTFRNRSTAGWVLNRAGNLVREGIKGPLDIVASVPSAIVQLGGAPFGKGFETSNYIESIPDRLLGTPDPDFSHNVDKEGYATKNPDGTLQSTHQGEIARGIGAVGGIIGTLGIAAAAEVPAGVVAATGLTVNTLGMSNASFKHVYNTTGDINKAYAAAAFAIPPSIITSVGELGIVSGAFRPALRGMSSYDRAIYMAQAFGRNAAIAGTSNGVADVMQQFGEISQTNEPFNPERTAEQVAIGAFGGGIAGTATDYLGARATFKENEALRYERSNKSLEELNKFSDSLETTKKTTALADDILQQDLDAKGLTASKNPDGTATISKKVAEVDIPKEPEGLVGQLRNSLTPEEIHELAVKQGELSQKENRTPNENLELDRITKTVVDATDPSYKNHIKVNIEKPLQTLVKTNPEAVPYLRYLESEDMWQNTLTGERSLWAKDVVFPKKVETTNDLSDVSNIPIIEEGKITDDKTSLRKIEKIKKKGYGATITKGDKKEIILTSDLTPEARNQVLAHELSHAISDKLNLSPEIKLAIQGRLAELKYQGLLGKAADVANEVFLPEVNKIIKTPKDATYKDLDKASKDALTSEKEFIANQVGAVMLKRSGLDIGDYKILPAIELALAKTKLPSLSETTSKVITPELVVEKPSKQKEITINPFTGETKETAYSKTVRESIPERPANMYDAMSRLKGSLEADKFVEAKGITEVLETLKGKDTYTITPEQRILMTDAARRKAKEEFDANPNAKTAENLRKADELRGFVLTSAAQTMAIAERIRGTDSFAEYLTRIDNIFKDAGLNPPEYTDLMIKELQTLYKASEGIDDGVLKNLYVQKIFDKTLQTQKISMPEFLSTYTKTNLLFGLGTQARNFFGGAFMAPIFTALGHPILGGGIVWKALANSKDLSFASAKRIIEGKEGNTLLGALFDPKPFQKTYVSERFPRTAKALNKFNKAARLVSRVMNAADTLNRSAAGEMRRVTIEYKKLKDKYKNNPDKLTAEAAKLFYSPDALKGAINQADSEGKALGLELTDADKYVRAYEILTRADTPIETLNEIKDWTDVTSLRGEVANPIQQGMHEVLTAIRKHELFGPISQAIVPFGPAIIRMGDFAQDVFPGNRILDKGWQYIKYFPAKRKGKTIKEGDIERPVTLQDFQRSPALQERLRTGERIGIGLAITALGLSRSGLFRITGDEEIVLDRGGEGDSIGKKANTKAQFEEFEQKGEAPYSIVFPNGTSFSYKDIPGLNAIMYGIYKANQALDKGENAVVAAGSFFRNAFSATVPFFGGISTLNSPYTNMIGELLNPELSEERAKRVFEQLATNTSKMVIPGSALLRDVKKLYDEDKEETNQELAIKIFKDIPIASEFFGSKPAINNFGEPQSYTLLERTPFLNAIVSQAKIPTDEVARGLMDKGIIIPELNRTVKFNKSDFGIMVREDYEATREERLGKAYVNSFTPDEWYNFKLTTGPQIKQAAIDVLNSGLNTADAQKEFSKRVENIRRISKQNYIRTGQF